ncbi:effector-associated constant component EACC1 [Nocardia carnea]|uniref:Uncharacterized protein n=1 Tax=Nocardia carnea TaxID=37328 RepID=A0ABW7TTH8_9NOCA|nr:hypothetical protein [Nocardia carnea]
MFITAEEAEELRDLGDYLSDTEELHGCVRSRSRPPGQEEMGPVLDALEIVVGPAGVTAATATAIVAWLRSRRTNVRITVKGADERSVDLNAHGVTALDATGLQELTTTLLDTLDPEQRPRLGE